MTAFSYFFDYIVNSGENAPPYLSSFFVSFGRVFLGIQPIDLVLASHIKVDEVSLTEVIHAFSNQVVLCQAGLHQHALRCSHFFVI